MEVRGCAAQEVVGFFVGQVAETENLADFAGGEELAEFGRDVLGVVLKTMNNGGAARGAGGIQELGPECEGLRCRELSGMPL